MAINDRDFYASHGISYDIEKMQIEYTKRVIRQAKIEVLTELKTEIEKLGTYDIERIHGLIEDCYASTDVSKIIQKKINSLKEAGE